MPDFILSKAAIMYLRITEKTENGVFFKNKKRRCFFCIISHAYPRVKRNETGIKIMDKIKHIVFYNKFTVDMLYKKHIRGMCKLGYTNMNKM